jgi:metacaspase-1
MDKLRAAQDLYAGANSFFRGLQHMGEQQQEGLTDAEGNHYRGEEPKRVIMYSGCRDDQTSADASIGGNHVGVS